MPVVRRLTARQKRVSRGLPGEDMTPKHFKDWENHIFGYGYGDGERQIIPALARFFRLLKDGHRYDFREMETAFGKLAAWLLINVLCHADIIEYGTSPRFGWLSEKGELLRDFMAGKTDEELCELAYKDSEHVYCDPGYCNCETPCRNPLFREGR
jgi:hypothetical protein